LKLPLSFSMVKFYQDKGALYTEDVILDWKG
jgi:hypothetical protein